LPCFRIETVTAEIKKHEQEETNKKTGTKNGEEETTREAAQETKGAAVKAAMRGGGNVEVTQLKPGELQR